MYQADCIITDCKIVDLRSLAVDARETLVESSTAETPQPSIHIKGGVKLQCDWEKDSSMLQKLINW